MNWCIALPDVVICYIKLFGDTFWVPLSKGNCSLLNAKHCKENDTDELLRN